MRNRESYDSQLSEPHTVKERAVQKGSRFNENAAMFLEQEFEEHGDVRRDFVTHAFPIQNLRGIVEEGGLRTGAFLERQGKQFRKGGEGWALGSTPPSNAGFDPTAIHFGQGFIHDTYTSRTGSEAALLFPQQEYERLRRLQTDSGPILEDTVNTKEYGVRSKERWTQAGIGQVAESTRAIVKQKELLDLEKYRMKYENLKDVAGSAFERKTDSLALKDIPRGQRLVMENAASVELQLDQLKQKAQEELQRANRQLPPSRREEEMTRLREMQKHAEEVQGRLHVLKQPRGFITRALDRFTGKAVRERGDQEDLERWLGEQNKRIKETETLLGAGQKAQQELEDIKQYSAAFGELVGAYRKLAKEAHEERQQIEKAYETYEMRGEKVRGIQERVRTMYQTQEAEDALQADLSHSIILVEKRHVAEVLETLRDKPGLISRVIVFDKERFPKQNRFTALNSVFEHLARDRAGIDLLVAAQLGKRTAHSDIKGVWRLEDYIKEGRNGQIRKAA